MWEVVRSIHTVYIVNPFNKSTPFMFFDNFPVRGKKARCLSKAAYHSPRAACTATIVGR